MVERFHRDLKQAVKIHCEKVKNWPDLLPSVVLGFKVLLKDDLRLPAQLAFGTQLRLPGEFVRDDLAQSPNKYFLDNMDQYFQAVKPFPISYNNSHKPYLPAELFKSKQVWIERIVKTPLSTPYEGPYPIVNKHDKYFTVNVNGSNHKISVDRLKPVIEAP